VSMDEIVARNYNLDIKNPHTEQESYGDPDELLADYQEQLAEAAELRARLKAELSAAIESVLGQ
ncbi:MAG: SAM-dependent DNA methyltransferase, partial [Chloroflexi bacterium]|nr:SAM-dependent DNA methyltransferase [Chloroflexota bacterium]